MITCPKCTRQWDEGCEQHACISKFQQCLFCYFVKGDGTQAELQQVIDLKEAWDRQEMENVVPLV